MSTLSPGPGAYDAKDSVVKAGGQSVKLGTSERAVGSKSVLIHNADMPGPGNYEGAD